MNILYQDDDLVAVNKPAGLLVHLDSVFSGVISKLGGDRYV